MKEYQLQTPKKDQHPHANRRSSKSISNYTKKTHQDIYSSDLRRLAKKCLDSAFTLVSEDVSLESPSIKLSSISENTDDHPLDESAESSILTLSPVISPSPETVTPSDLSPLTSSITREEDEPNNLSVFHFSFAESKNSDDMVAMEADMVVNHLKLARIQLRNSTDVDISSRKLLDALIELVIEEFDGLREENDRFAELVTMKRRIVFVSVFLWILVSVIFLFRSCGGKSSFSEPLPT